MEHTNVIPRGLVVEPILIGEDYLGGTTQSLEAKYGGTIINDKGDWSDYTPSTEQQDTSDGDTWACVSFGTSNAIEMLARFNFKEQINLSDRFLAKTSGTVVGHGNSPKTVADTLRHGWTVNEPEWPDVNTVEEFYAEPPSNLKTVAVARGAEFEFGYQYINNTPASIKALLKTSPVCIAVTAWQADASGVYQRIPGISENHWTCIIKVLDNGNYQVFDSFYPFIKEVSPEACKSIAMSYYLNKNIVSDSLFTRFMKAILALFTQSQPDPAPLPAPTPTPMTVPTTPPAPKYDWSNPTACRHSARMIMDEMGLTGVVDKPTGLMAKDLLCMCIKQESGWNPKAIGKPNKNGTQDFGLCQYNNGHNAKGVPLWIGKGAVFKDTNEVLNDPEKNVRIMVKTYLAGHLNWWASYSTGAYRKWPTTA